MKKNKPFRLYRMENTFLRRLIVSLLALPVGLITLLLAIGVTLYETLREFCSSAVENIPAAFIFTVDITRDSWLGEKAAQERDRRLWEAEKARRVQTMFSRKES